MARRRTARGSEIEFFLKSDFSPWEASWVILPTIINSVFHSLRLCVSARDRLNFSQRRKGAKAQRRRGAEERLSLFRCRVYLTATGNPHMPAYTKMSPTDTSAPMTGSVNSPVEYETGWCMSLKRTIVFVGGMTSQHDFTPA